MGVRVAHGVQNRSAVILSQDCESIGKKLYKTTIYIESCSTIIANAMFDCNSYDCSCYVGINVEKGSINFAKSLLKKHNRETFI